MQDTLTNRFFEGACGAALVLFMTTVPAAAGQNILVVPGQENMQEQQADIMDRTEQEEAAQAARSQAQPGIVVPQGQAYGEQVEDVDKRQLELEAPSRRQLDDERGSRRQQRLELPEGPGVKY